VRGWAWSDHVGWICFGITCTGDTPETGVTAPYAQYRPLFNGKYDQVYGWAQVVNMGDNGWISLNCDRDVGPDVCGTSNFHLGLNPSTGYFILGNSGSYDYGSHFAWGGNSSGTGIGWVDFA